MNSTVKRVFSHGWVGLLALWVLSLGQAQGAVEQIKAVLRFEQAAPDKAFTQRLERTFQAVTAKALEEAPGWEQNPESYETVLRDVLERAYRGYRVKAVNLSSEGGTVYASATLAVFGEVVEDTTVALDYSPMPDVLEKVLAVDVATLREQLNGLWRGFPVENRVWAQSLMMEQVTTGLSELPDLGLFDAGVDLTVGSVTQVRLTLRPRRPVLTDVGVKIDSTLLPNVLLDDVRYALVAALAPLRGLPMALLHGRPELVTVPVKEAFEDLGLVRRLKLEGAFQPEMDGGRLMVRARVGSRRVRLYGGGHLDVGHGVEEGRIDGHLGLRLGRNLEVFTEPAVKLSPVKLVGDVGVALTTFDWFTLAVGRDLTNKKDKWWGHLRLSHDVGISYESRAVGGLHRELGLWYRANDFYTFGVYNHLDEDTWVRLRANL